MMSELAIKLNLRADSPAVAKRVFDIVAEYVQPESQFTPSQTAVDLDKLVPDSLLLEGFCEAFTKEFWWAFLAVARQAPSGHISQQRLVEVVVALKSISTHANELENSTWYRLEEGLEDILRHIYFMPFPTEERDEPYQEWVNINAFTSRLFGGGHIEVDLSYFAISTMGLIGPTSYFVRGETWKPLLEWQIKAAEQWMTHAALRTLRALQTTSKPKPGPQLWMSWKEDLAGLDHVVLSDDGQTVVSRVIALMEAAEKEEAARKYMYSLWDMYT